MMARSDMRHADRQAPDPIPHATRKQVDDLKAEWLRDPCYDINLMHDDPVFGPFAEELAAFQAAKEAAWQERVLVRLHNKAVAIGCPGNVTLAAYVELLESRIEKLETPS